MTICRFVHLSDIHFGQERPGEVFANTNVREKLLADARAISERRGKADLILVAGDIAYAGKEDEYEKAGEWLDRLADAVKCRDTDVRVVPGNHDCDRKQVTRLTRTVHRNIRGGTPKSADADLAEMAGGSDEANPLLPKLQAYRDFAASYQSDFSSIERPLWEKSFDLGKGTTLRIVGMNSVQVSDDEDAPGKLVLGSAQYILLNPDEGSLYATVMHHPLDWYMDKLEAKPYLRRWARIVMVGHEHIPSIVKASDELGSEWLDIYSGATTPPAADSVFKYTYNWLEISLKDIDERTVLSISVYPRVWVPEKTEFGPDLLRLGGKECAEFDIVCPDSIGKKRRAVKARGSNGAESEALTVSKSKVDAVLQKDAGMAEDAGMAGDEEAVAKLKLLFWRHLDWQQRIKVLVQADALPSTADKPVPQTMERLALENARRKGKMSAIWEAMMQYVPANKKEPNPFSKR